MLYLWCSAFLLCSVNSWCDMAAREPKCLPRVRYALGPKCTRSGGSIGSHTSVKGDSGANLTASSIMLIKCQNAMNHTDRHAHHGQSDKNPQSHHRWSDGESLRSWGNEGYEHMAMSSWRCTFARWRGEQEVLPWSTVVIVPSRLAGDAAGHMATCSRRRELWWGPVSPTGRPQAGCVGIGRYDVQPGGGMHRSDIMCVCLRVCMWRKNGNYS